MFRSGVKLVGIAALALGALAFGAETAFAQQGGMRGGYGGAYNLGGGYGGRGGYWGGGYGPSYGWYGSNGWPNSYDYGYTGYSYPYGVGTDYRLPSYSATTYYPPYSDSGLFNQFTYPQGMSGYYNPSDSLNSRAIRVELRVPPNAQVWFDGNPTQQQGVWRAFQSPPVDSDKTMHYTVRARWTDQNGQPVDETRKVAVRAGQRTLVDFFRPEPSGNSSRPEKTGKPSESTPKPANPKPIE